MIDTLINGCCHCGNIRFALQWPGTNVHVRHCGCSFCQKHGGAWTSHADARLSVTIGNAQSVSKYRFGTKTADFYVCSTCGIVPFVACEIDGAIYAVVNVHAFENTDALVLTDSATDFDGENVGSRLERRRKNWLANVTIVDSGSSGR